jgi:hypothetical protein
MPQHLPQENESSEVPMIAHFHEPVLFFLSGTEEK